MVRFPRRVIRTTCALAVLTLAYSISQAVVLRGERSDPSPAEWLEPASPPSSGEAQGIPQRMQELLASVGTLSAAPETVREAREASAEPALDLTPERRIDGLAAAGPSPLPLSGSAPASESADGSSTAFDTFTLLRRASELAERTEEARKASQAENQRRAAIPAIAPAAGYLSSPFSPSRHHPILRITRPHQGIDIAARLGTPILAPARGTVRFAGTRSDSYGLMVEIDHGYGMVTRFAHASRILVRGGERVERGQIIAKVGATGLATGPHLHYEVLLDGRQVDPLQFGAAVSNLPMRGERAARSRAGVTYGSSPRP